MNRDKIDTRESDNGHVYFAYVCNYPGERQYFASVEDGAGAPLYRGRFYNNKREARADARKMLFVYASASAV